MFTRLNVGDPAGAGFEDIMQASTAASSSASPSPAGSASPARATAAI
jgi:hypothetical protein